MRGGQTPLRQFLYFAYGSNMLTQRLQARCPSARPCGTASVGGYRLSFDKLGEDASGKARLMPAGRSSRVHGVLFEVDEADRLALDDAEGLGLHYTYHPDFALVRSEDGAEITAGTYLAVPATCRPDAVPFGWYHALVISGARQHGLPQNYIAGIAAVAHRPDPQPDRPGRRAALAALQAAGFGLETA